MAKSTAVSGLEDHVGYWLRYVSNHVSQAFAARVDAHGVTVAEWVLLREMLHSAAVHPSVLAQQLGMTRGAISKLVERLRQKKLVECATSDGDRRYMSVRLTLAGKRIVPKLARLADENDHEFFGDLSPEERAKLVMLLQDIVRRHGWKDLPVD